MQPQINQATSGLVVRLERPPRSR